MDPVTVLIFVFVGGWLARNAVEDIIAVLRGRPSPRIARRIARDELTRRHTAETGVPPVHQVIVARLAYRLAHPPERQAWARFRAWLDQVLADAWEDALSSHEHARKRRHIARRRRRAEQTVPGRQARTPGRWFTSPADGEPAEPDDPDVVDVDWYDTPAAEPEPVRDPDPTPPPTANPPPDTTRKDPSVTHPPTVDGDVNGPIQAFGFCDGALAFNGSAIENLDKARSNLEGLKLGEEFIEIIGGAVDVCDQFADTVNIAAGRYAQHAATQYDLASNPDLRDALVGYLHVDRS